MAKKLKYLTPVYKDNGKVYWYFRRRGMKKTAVEGIYGSEEFKANYHAVLDTSRTIQPVGLTRSAPGTVSAVIAGLYPSIYFTEGKRGPREQITMDTDRNLLERFRVKAGERHIATLQEKHIGEYLSEIDGPAAKRNMLRVLRLLLDYAIAMKLRRDNPARNIKLAKLTKTKGFHSWTEDELRQYEAHHKIGTKARLAMAMLLYTCERRKDIVELGERNVRPPSTPGACSRFYYEASKNRAVLDIPIAPPLARIIEKTPMVGLQTFLVTEYGNKFSFKGFGNKFKDWCRQANLPHCTAHGLRKCFLRRMAEAGCSEDFIASISGHTDMREIRVYVREARKARMADDAMAMTLAAFPEFEELDRAS